MNTSIKIIIAAIIALGIGLAAGYFIFGSQQHSVPGEETPSSAESAAPSGNEKEQIWTCSMHPQIRQNEPAGDRENDCGALGRLPRLPLWHRDIEHRLGYLTALENPMAE